MDEFKYDKFENGRRFQALCHETNFICPTCSRKITEIRKRKKQQKLLVYMDIFV